MKWQEIFKWSLIVGLALLQASVTEINWLLVVMVWMGARSEWGQIWLAGLWLDLVTGNRLGWSSGEFLLVGAVSYWLSERFPDISWWMKKDRQSGQQLKLQIE